MEMSGERLIAASPDAVWAALNDPVVLKTSIPGCEAMDRTAPDQFVATVVQKIGPVHARFTGDVVLSDIVEGKSYRISGHGKGGGAGSISGGATVTLDPADGGTLLTYNAEATVTGKIAQLGSRLVAIFARKTADAFFDRFKAHLEGTGAAEKDEESGGIDLDEVIDTVEEKTSALAGQAGTIIDSVTDTITETAEDVFKSASETYHDLTDRDESGKSKIDKAADSLDRQSREAAGDLGKVVDKMTDSIEDTVEDVGKAIADSPPAKKSFWKRLFGG